MATHEIRWMDWKCTRCAWQGDYWSTMGVMYGGVDWQNCPNCGAVAIPTIGSTRALIEQEMKATKKEVKDG